MLVLLQDLSYFCWFIPSIAALGCLWWWIANVFGETLPLIHFFFFVLGESVVTFTLLLCWFFRLSIFWSKGWFWRLEWKPRAEFPPPLDVPDFRLFLLVLLPRDVLGLLSCSLFDPFVLSFSLLLSLAFSFSFWLFELSLFLFLFWLNCTWFLAVCLIFKEF